RRVVGEEHVKRNKLKQRPAWLWMIVAALIAAPIGGLNTTARAAEGGPDPNPNTEAQKTIDISLPEDFYFKGDSTTATVTATGNAGETIEVSLSGPGIAPSHLTLTSGVSQNVNVTLPSGL